MGSGMTFRAAFPIALGSDTLSITTMEIVDTIIVLLIPGAMAAGLLDPLFWGSLGVALLIAAVVAFPVNRWLIAAAARLMHRHRISAPARERPSGVAGNERVAWGACACCQAPRSGSQRAGWDSNPRPRD